MQEHSLINRLSGGKRWSTDKAHIVADEVLQQPELFTSLLDGLTHPEPLTRMRVAYAIAKIAKKQPDLLYPHKEYITDRLAAPDNSHLAKACLLQTVPVFSWTPEELEVLVAQLKDCLFSDSSIVKTFALELLVQFADNTPDLRQEVMPLLWNALDHGTPAMRARARKLVKKYKL